MRQIKFNAWDVERALMLHHVNIVDGKAVEHGYQFFTQPGDTLIPLEYIGQKDKNGKEIFEGHILAGVSQINGVEVIDSNPRLYEVIEWTEKYDDSRDGWGQFSAGFHLTGYGASPGCFVIIGNIYENPELLK